MQNHSSGLDRGLHRSTLNIYFDAASGLPGWTLLACLETLRGGQTARNTFRIGSLSGPTQTPPAVLEKDNKVIKPLLGLETPKSISVCQLEPENH